MEPIKWWNIELGVEEQEAVLNAIANRKIAQGDITEEFEEKVARFLKVPYAVAEPNGTQALSLAYMALGIGINDEVIISNRTFVATAHAAMILGAKIRVIDVKENQTINEELIEKEITKNTKLIVPVHMNGVASNMDRILEIAKKHNLEVIEDACQAFGSRDSKGRYLGSIGRFGCFSLGLAKILTTGQGGIVTAHSQEDYNLLRKIRNQGVFDVRRERSYGIMAYNFKFNDMLAAIGLVQLQKIHQKIKHSQELYRSYCNMLQDKVRFLKVNIENGEVPIRFIVMVENNKDLKEYLYARGIESSFESPSLNRCSHLGIVGQYPKSDVFDRQMLILPSGPDQKLKNTKRVSSILMQWLDGVK